MKTRKQIEEEYRLKQNQLIKERDEEIRENERERATIRRPIDDEYWAKRKPLDDDWEAKLKAAGVD